jgi:AcrR family transcriptional regulator
MVETRRQQIENAASVLFRERGYAATSVRDIAQVLNLQGASLYAHVASKEDLLWSIVERAADRFESAVAPIAAAETHAPQRLRVMVRAHIGVVTDDLGNAVSFLGEWRFLSPDRRTEVASRRRRYEGRFREVIAQGVASGDFAAGTDPRLAATWMLSALNGIAVWYHPDGDLTPEAIADRYADLLLGGLTCPPPRLDPSTDPARRTDS